MDRIRTLLLARTHVVVMDPDLVASAATRPSRDTDADKLEIELLDLGFVMSLDLATMIRRLPYQTVLELREWMHDTLAHAVGDARPQVPSGSYLRRMTSFLASVPEQPCPWCGEIKEVGALEPCGHLVCTTCWQSAGLMGCPICHRRIGLAEPFAKPSDVRVAKHPGTLALLHLGVDVLATARERFERLLLRAARLTDADREEIEAVIDTVGPQAVAWLPPRIPRPDTNALAIARLWLISPDRAAIMRETASYVKTATDVLRIAAVLMRGNAELVEPMRLVSIDRALRRAVLETLEQLPLEEVVEHMMRWPRLWKRVGERLHPFERADALPNTALAFAALRGTRLSTTSFGAVLRERAVRLQFVYVEDDRIKPIAWAGPIEAALRANNPRSALARLTHRPGELLRRADHIVRIAQTRQLDALQTVVKAVELASVKGPPATMLALASHVARRGRAWPRRVFIPRADPLSAWNMRDLRPPLRGDAIAVMVGAVRRQLVARAEMRRQFPRAIIDRALVDLALPLEERTPSRGKLAWPRGSEIGLPSGQELRLFGHWEQPPDAPVELELSVAFFDDDWEYLATCDRDHAILGEHAAAHATSTGRASTALVDLHFEKLARLGARHLVLLLAGERPVAFDRLPHGFVGVVVAPAEGDVFDSRSVERRFDLRGRAQLYVPLAIDLGERRLRWLDVRVNRRGLPRSTLAHLGRDFADLAGVGARPTLWDVACIHASARANIIYVRERDGMYTMYRRRDAESKVARLGRLLSGTGDDGRLHTLPPVEAPTWFALVNGVPLSPGSVGYALDARGLAPECERVTANDLIRELSLR